MSDAPGADPILSALPPTAPAAEEIACLPRGFRALGATIGIKKSGRPDLAVIATTGGPAAAAGVFTRNAFKAAPVRLTQSHLEETEPAGSGGFGWASAILGTSGSANAATGAPGDADQARLARALAAALAVHPSQTLAISTGVIGVRLPADLVESAIAERVPGGLETTSEAFARAGAAIMTTDSRAKSATVRVALPDADGAPVSVTVSGIAKGVGMIHPGMATMLAVILTDATVDPATLHRLLRPVAAHTWNQLTVDGDTSTNDTVLVLASGAAGAAPVVPGESATLLGAALHGVARSLARQQAADGEGATTLITCQVSGALDNAEARAIARSVVASSLFKAAVHGRDPNWGRVAAAAANGRLPDAAVLEAAGCASSEAEARAGRPVRVEPDRLRVAIAGHLVYAGQPVPFDRSAASAAMAAPEVLVRLDCGLGGGTGEAFGCDLTEAYVRENSEYTT
jgi:glutamate N-acetyltransferase/amino-acid N-acetyltransferase